MLGPAASFDRVTAGSYGRSPRLAYPFRFFALFPEGVALTV